MLPLEIKFTPNRKSYLAIAYFNSKLEKNRINPYPLYIRIISTIIVFLSICYLIYKLYLLNENLSIFIIGIFIGIALFLVYLNFYIKNQSNKFYNFCKEKENFALFSSVGIEIKTIGSKIFHEWTNIHAIGLSKDHLIISFGFTSTPIPISVFAKTNLKSLIAEIFPLLSEEARQKSLPYLKGYIDDHI